MTENEAILNSLEEKIKTLISLYDQVKGENKVLTDQNRELQDIVALKDTEIKDLQTKCEHLKLAKLLTTDSNDVHEAKLKVNRMVREIDKCIALLNK